MPSQVQTAVAALLVCLMAVWVPLGAEEIALQPPFQVQPNSRLFKWDRAHNALIFYRSEWKQASAAIHLYTEGIRPGLRFSPLKHFPLAQEISIWDVAAAPHGGCLVLGILYYGEREIEHVILRYEASGSLTQVWRMEPYHHHKLAVDRDGNVFAFGHRLDVPDPPKGPDYPLLIKYSPDGQVLQEFLLVSQFPQGVDVVSSGGRFGEPFLFVDGDSLFLFVAATKEILRFDLEGRLLERGSLSTVFEGITAAAGKSRAEVWSLAVSKEGQLVAQVRLWPRDRKVDAYAFQMVEITPDGSGWKPLSGLTPLPYPGAFLGMSKDSKFLFLGRLRTGQTALGRYATVPQ